MKKNNKKTQLLAFLLMITFVLLWLTILFVFYSLDSFTARRTFAVMLLSTPIIIIILDRPTIFMDIANALLETISYLIMKFFEWVDKYIKESKIPKYKRRVMKKDRRVKRR